MNKLKYDDPDKGILAPFSLNNSSGPVDSLEKCWSHGQETLILSASRIRSSVFGRSVRVGINVPGVFEVRRNLVRRSDRVPACSIMAQ